MIAIAGRSGSGKSTLLNNFFNNSEMSKEYVRVKQVTTRPRRINEVCIGDNPDYEFLTNDEFENDKCKGLIKFETNYRGWKYGISEDYLKMDNAIGIFTPNFIWRMREKGYKVKIIYLHIDRRDALINTLTRGDDVEECVRRNQSDEGMFSEVHKIADEIVIYRPIQNGVLEAFETAIKTFQE